ncbi:DUF4893 domain-containing protein [Sphingomonas sp.]|uniref:DUF4893 domain-containing protein n=1 Tax=Sphingomonas sp. TaxID=28214 RepID=UPI002DD6B27E|nr:DUF4893 domain-containing protein [Sphingomonas sp.]
MRRAFLAAFLLAPMMAGCAAQTGRGGGASVTVEPVEAWREAADAGDAERIDELPAAWARAIQRIPVRSRSAVTAEGALLTPDAALDHPELSPGSYSCRVLRLEANRLRSFPANFCYVQSGEGNVLTLAKQTGSELPAGLLYPSADRRYVFLGARQQKPGETALTYGADRERDVAGVVERVGSFRWRLVLPERDGRRLDVLELTPVPVERQPG